ncbi:MAG: leucine--tRNA ligase [Actinobacteria bacterium]|nr:leucine--tRNA ligase [Actinomycetota bacterium]
MSDAAAPTADDTPRHRYDARLATEIEAKWQDRWEERRTFWAPNPSGPLSEGFAAFAERDKLFVLDMFPYPSGAGLHVGHPLGYIGTDVYARFKRMTGYNVLHAMGYDAFGLPAEQYAVQTGQHPRVTTEANIANMRRQLRALGLGHDPRRSIATTDVAYYRWTQWIFLQIFNAFYDADADRARPIDELIPLLEADPEVGWSELTELERRELVDGYRLAYLDEAQVNWCPALGTVLANEEVTADGRSERGNHPVYRRPLKQWMLRITAYAERLLADLDALDWSDSIKLMQRNWIGRSEGAEVDFPVAGHEDAVITVFTTRPDTLFGATYMVLAPEHPLLDVIVPNEWPDAMIGEELNDVPADWRGIFGTDVGPPEAIRRYREFAAQKSELERQAEGRVKTGVFTGAFATNPVNGAPVPVFVADYVLMGYGTGAIMAVPAHDQRDFEFAQEFSLPIRCVVQPSDTWLSERGVGAGTPAGEWPEAFTGDGVGVHSTNDGVSLDGLHVEAAKQAINGWLEAEGLGLPTVTYKLRDWLFSRQRYWGEPFPIVYDEHDLPVALPDAMLPVELPEITDFEPEIVADDVESVPAPPLARAERWVMVELDLGDGPKTYGRELNTMPQWAGSCWYYLRYLDPTNETAFVSPSAERYWMAGARDAADGAANDRPPGIPAGSERDHVGGVDLYVGGVEHAVLHLLYARFWHKVLFDLGHVSTSEPFQRLFNQGYIQAHAYTDARGAYVEASDVVERDGRYFLGDQPVDREYRKMGKSLRNVVTPDEMYREYGADTLRLYEMSTGPLDASRPWSTRDIVGVHRFLQRLWRNLVDEGTGLARLTTEPADDETRRLLHRTIAGVRGDMADLGFNTAIAKLITLNNRLTQVVADRGAAPDDVATALVLMVAPLAPHVAEELWERMGHATSLAHDAFPVADPAWLAVETVEVPVQENGKVRHRVTVPSDADADTTEAVARADPAIAAMLAGRTVRKVVVVPARLVNFVVG